MLLTFHNLLSSFKVLSEKTWIHLESTQKMKLKKFFLKYDSWITSKPNVRISWTQLSLTITLSFHWVKSSCYAWLEPSLKTPRSLSWMKRQLTLTLKQITSFRRSFKEVSKIALHLLLLTDFRPSSIQTEF